MKQELNNIVRSIFGKDSLEDVSRDELVLLSGEYPYSPVIQYLHTRKLQQMGDPRFADSVSRTALYFSNPHWLHHQLRGRSNAEKIAEMEEQFLVVADETTEAAIEPQAEWATPPQEVISEGAADNDDDLALPLIDDTADIVTEPATTEQIVEAAIEPEAEWATPQQEVISEGAAENDDDLVLPLTDGAADIVTEPDATEQIVEAAIEPEAEWATPPQEGISDDAADNDDDLALPLTDGAAAIVTEPDATEQIVETAIEPESEFTESIKPPETKELTAQDDPYEGGYESIAFEQSTEAICDPLSGGTNDGETSGYTHESDAGTIDLTGFEAEDEFADLPEIITRIRTPHEESLNSRSEEAVTASDDDVSEQHTEPLEMSANLNHTDAGEAMGHEPPRTEGLEDLIFEPMHSIDYFASQGIELGEEATSEALVRPLRSFTGWIRSMKQIQPAKQKQMLDEQSEQIIRSKAEYSNETEVVLTESMALVYEKQGMVKKALDILEKLSLLDPAKKDIFAAKIQELKGKSI